MTVKSSVGFKNKNIIKINIFNSKKINVKIIINYKKKIYHTRSLINID